MLLVLEYNYNTKAYRADVLPGWLHLEAIRLDLLDRVVYVGF